MFSKLLKENKQKYDIDFVTFIHSNPTAKMILYLVCVVYALHTSSVCSVMKLVIYISVEKGN